MNKFLEKAPKIALWGLMGITVLLLIATFFTGEGDVVTYNNIEYNEPAYINWFMYWTYVLAFLAVGITLAFLLVKFFKNGAKDPKSIIKPLIIFVVAILVFVIAYLMGDGTPLNIPGYDGTDNVASWLKITDMFLYVTYLLAIVAFGLIIYSAVKNIIKK